MAIKFLSGLNLSNVTAGSILKLDSNGNIVAATAGTDYVASSLWTASGSNIYYSSGNVTIGASSNSAPLHVYAYQTTDPKILIEDGNTGDASMQFKISTQQYTMGIDNSDSDKFVLAASSALGTTNALEINTSGKITVPAATSNGAVRFEVGGYNRLRFNGGIDLLGYTQDHLWIIGNSGTSSINLGGDWDWDKQIAISYTPNTVGNYGGVLSIGQTEKNNANWTHGVTRFYTSGGERMRIDSAGNVGIGTTAPEVGLHYHGAVDGEHLMLISNTKTYGTGTGINETAALGFAIKESSTTSLARLFGKIIASTNAETDSSDGTLTFQVRDSGSLSTAMTIKNTGNVGIGTTSPGAKLEVAGDDQEGVRVSGGTNGRFTQLGGSELSFYTTSTSGWAMGNIVRKNSDSSVLGYISGGYGQDNALTYTYYGGTAYNSAAMYILSSNNNVGIGTSSPDFKLDVAGDIGMDGKLYHNGDHNTYIGFGGDIQTFRTGGSDRMTITNSGIGIGTTSPGTLLDVNGVARIQDLRFVSSGGFKSGYSTWLDGATAQNVLQQGFGGLAEGGTSDHLIFNAPDLYESTTTSGGSYSDVTSTYASSWKDLFTGQRDSVMIANQSVYSIRMTWDNIGYKWFDTFYSLVNLQGNVFSVKVEKYNGTAWTTVFTRTGFTGWEGRNYHTYKWNNSGHSSKLRITLDFTWNNTNAAYIYRIAYYGGYPSYGGGRVFDWDYDKNLNLGGSNLKINGGTILSDDGTSHYVHSASNLYLYSGSSATMTLASGGNVGIGETNPTSKLEVRGATATHQLVSINRANSSTAALYLGNNSSNDAIISGNNAPISLGKDVSGTYTEYVNIATDGELKFSAYGAGILKTNSAGIVSLDTNTYLTSIDVDWNDIDSINGTININSTTQIGQGDTETLVSFQNSGTERGRFEVDDSANSYFVATGFKTTGSSTGLLKSDGTIDTSTYATTADINSFIEITDVATYLSTNNYVTTSYTGFVAVAGDTMTGNLSFNDNGKVILGTGSDFEMFHNGSNTFLQTTTGSVGDLYITARGTNHDLYLEAADDIFIRPQGNESGIDVIGNGAVKLYYNGAMKLETTDDGINVPGVSQLGTTCFYSHDVGVGDADGNDIKWTLKDNNGNDVTSTSSGVVYRLRLVTLGTGTNTGAVYICDNVDGAGWRTKKVASVDGGAPNSNYPFVEIDGGVPKVTIQHNNTYNVRVFVEAFIGGNGGASYTMLGLDSGITNENGSVLMSLSSSTTEATSVMIGADNILRKRELGSNAFTSTTYAPLASPGLTGTPTAPTAAAGTNTTQIATTAFVSTAVSNLVDSAPAALDTLNELAAALGDDANFSTTVTNSIATKLPLAGGTMTGDLIVPNLRSDQETSGTITNGNWYRVLELNGSSGRGKCEFILESNGGSGTPFSLRGAISTTWSAGDQTLTIHHNSLGSISEMRVVRNSAGNRNYLDIKTTGEDNVTFTILPHRKINAEAIDFTDVTTLPSGDTVQDSVTISDKTIISQAGNYSAFTVDKDSSVTVKDVIASGNIGINTTSPATKLNIDLGSGGSNGLAGLRIGGTSNYASLELGTFGAYGGMVRSYGNDLHYFSGHWRTIGNTASENHSHYWYTSKAGSSDWSTVKMELDHNGNLGIGTTSPGAKLDVEGGSLGNTSGDSTTAAIIRAGRQNLVFKDTRTANGTDWNNATFKVIAQIDTTDHQSIDFVNDSGYLEHIDLRVGNQVFSTRFASNGNVGIGTTSPGGKLHLEGNFESGKALVIKGTYGTDTEYYFRTHGTNSELLSLYAAGVRVMNWRSNRIDTYQGLNILGGDITTDSNNALTLGSSVQVGQGDEDPIVEFKHNSTQLGKFDQAGYLYATGFKTSGTTGFLKSDGSVDTSTYASSTHNHDSSYVLSTGGYYDEDFTWDGTHDFSNVIKVSGATATTTNTTALFYGTNGVIEKRSLGSAAFSDSTDFAAASHTHSYLPLAGGTLTGDLLIDTGTTGSTTQAYSAFDSLQFNNQYSSVAAGPNKIVMYDDGGSWVGGFGIHTSTVGYYSGDTHKWYKTASGPGGPTFTQKMSLDSSGNLAVTGTFSASGYNNTNWDTAYGWGNHASANYLTSYTETSTLGQVLTRGNSTNNTIHIYHTDRAYTFQTDTNWGGWARTPFYFEDGSGNGFGGLGAYGGNGTTLSKYYIGSAYNSNIIEFHTDNSVIMSGNLTLPDKIIHSGDADTYIKFDADRVRIVAGNVTKFDSNTIYTGTVQSVSGAGTVSGLTLTSDDDSVDPTLTLGGSITTPVSGDWWNNGFAKVGTDGVMEIGKYIDFHDTDTETDDFSYRITASNTALTFSGALSVPEFIYHTGDSNTYVWLTADRIRLVAGGTTKLDTSNTYLLQSTNISVRNITARDIVSESDRTYSLGTDANRWAVVFCETLDSAGQHESKLQNPEGETPISEYETGTVLVWKGGKNVPCTKAADHMRMGVAVKGIESPLVQGAEPVLCTGEVKEGDYLVTSTTEGHAEAISPEFMRQHMLFDCVIGKALENGDGESHLVKTWINI